VADRVRLKTVLLLALKAHRSPGFRFSCLRSSYCGHACAVNQQVPIGPVARRMNGDSERFLPARTERTDRVRKTTLASNPEANLFRGEEGILTAKRE
jgi:hypothetical protein